MSCLEDFLKSKQGKSFANSLLFSKKGDIIGFKQSITLIIIESAAVEGVKVLRDLRQIESDYGFDRTFSFSGRFYDYETYVVFFRETVTNIVLALVAVFFVLMIVTANFTVTLFILFSLHS